MRMPVYNDAIKLKKRKRFLFKIYLIIGFFGAMIVLTIYLLFFANLFDIRSINIEGSTTVARDELQSKIDDWLDSRSYGLRRRSNSFLLISAIDLKQLIATQYPKLESLTVTKKNLHQLDISYTDRKPLGIWCIEKDNKCFYFDKEGIAYAEAAQSSGFIYTMIRDQRDRTIDLGQNISDKTLIQKILDIKGNLQSIDLSIAEFIIPADSFEEISAKTTAGWKILFSTAIDNQKQILALQMLFKNKLSSQDRIGLHYIDLRIQDRIYYQ